MTGEGKRTFKELQKNILISLKKAPLTINEISNKAGINWNSTSNQLIILKGRDYVEEVFKHRRLRLFKITELGKEVIR